MAAIEISGRYTVIQHDSQPASVGKKAWIRRRATGQPPPAAQYTDTFDVQNENGQNFPGNPVKVYQVAASGEVVLGAWGGLISTFGGVTITFPGQGGAPNQIVVWKRD